MHSFNFDKPINRLQTGSVRWDKYDPHIIPLWVADMDFASPPCVIDALKQRMNHEIFGYTHAPEDLKDNIATYLAVQYQWKVEPAWFLVFTRWPRP